MDRALPGAVAIAQALIRARSVTPDDDGALPYLAEMLTRAGFACELVSFDAPGLPRIGNLFAKLGVGHPHFVFAGHTDVVPPGPLASWRHDPFAGAIENGVLYGRGAVDMKGGLAASLAAALAFVAERPFTGAISFLVTGDEEGPAVNGTVKLLEWAKARGEVFDHCALGEPTSGAALGDIVKNGRRGSLTGRLTLHGRQGHVAYPHLADNPLRRIGRVCDALYAPSLDSGTPHFDASNLEIVTVDVGNRATNVIPAEAMLVFNVRFNDIWNAQSLAAELRGRVERALDGAGFTLTFEPSNADAFLTAQGAFTDLVGDAIHDVVGRRPAFRTNGGTSDARFIKNYCPVIEFGPVGKTMHALDECVPVAELEALERIYRRVLERYFA
jgi:succinyl-diaminopimelate desuccinylase